MSIKQNKHRYRVGSRLLEWAGLLSAILVFLLAGFEVQAAAHATGIVAAVAR